MKNLDTIQEQLAFSPAKLINEAFAKGYPLALWRMPHGKDIRGILDLRPDHIYSPEDIESSDPAFLLNSFTSHHPSQPSFVKGDIIFKWHQNKPVETRIHPSISGEEIDAFRNKPPENRKSFTFSETHYADFDYVETVKKAISHIRKGYFSKVVLSRYDDEKLPEDFDAYRVFEQAAAQYPNAFVYLTQTPQHGIWLGATPETLLSVEAASKFKTVSLAGTQRLENGQNVSSVAWTQKEIEEQAMVSRYIIDCFKKIRLREFEEIGPRTVKAGNLAHLQTEYLVDLQEVNMPQLGSIMLDLLHPTSAVCGMPLQPSLDFIRIEEKYDRELYAGFLGPVNIDELTHLFVNLRCMKIMGDTGRFYAGAGITEDSDASKEYVETQMKMQTLKRLIFDRNPNN